MNPTPKHIATFQTSCTTVAYSGMYGFPAQAKAQASHRVAWSHTATERCFGVECLSGRQAGYASDLSIWLSRKFLGVDPLAFKYPHESPYSYVGNRPVNIIDPWGMDKIEDPNGTSGEAGAGYKQTADKKYLYGDGLKTKVWDPNYEADEHYGQNGGGMANPKQKGGYGGLGTTFTQDVSRNRTGALPFGQNWTTTSINLNKGSKLLIGGSTGAGMTFAF